MIEILLESIKYLLPSIVVLVTAYLLLSSMLKNNLRVKEVEVLLRNRQESIPLRLQAYERLVLFLERISLENLVKRLHNSDLTAAELHAFLLTTVRNEFEHNITQQLYVSPECWALVKVSAEETVSIINGMARKTDPKGPAIELAKNIFEYMAASDNPSPNQNALLFLQDEAKQLF